MCSLEELKNYDEIKEEFSNANILLGNGFSINFSDTFRYEYLYKSFIKSCSNTYKKLFKGLNTCNFEKVLKSLENNKIAKTVCESLNINYNEFENHKIEIKKGLIKAVNNIHPKSTDSIWSKVNRVSSQFCEFDDIFTTNYDILLYYIILWLNNKDKYKFGDYFSSISPIGYGPPDKKYTFFNNKTDSRHRHHIYYLHGALFLFEQNFNTCKIKAKSNWLLNNISEEIENNHYPIFVSEGTSDSKRKAIKSNDYLTFCIEQFENKINSDKRLVIFGHSLSDQDQHLVDIINKNCEKIAISINSDDIGKLERKKSSFRNRLERVKEIFFYDSKTLFNFDAF